MSTNYPGALDSFTNPTATDTLDSATVPHATQHANENDAIEAIQVTLGVNPQGGSATVVARLDSSDDVLASHTSSYTAHGATANNTASRIVLRDASGNFSAGTITATLNGNASSATTATSATTAATASAVAASGITGTTLASNVTASSLTSFGSSPALSGTPTAPTAAVDTNTTQVASTAFVLGQAASVTPSMNGTAAVGTSTRYARADHVHASDTSKLSTTGGTLTGSLTANGIYASGTSNVTIGTSGSASGSLVFGNVSGIQVLQPSTGSGTQTLPSAAGTLLNTASTTSALTTVGTIGTGTWRGTGIEIGYGGTGHTYGAALIGKAVLVTSPTKALNDTTPEAVFRNASGTIQYFNVDADTTYAFDGMLQLNVKASAGSAARLSLIYVATGSTSTVNEQSARLIFNTNHTASTYVGVGGGSAANISYDGSITVTAATSFHINFRGFIRTNATTAGRINLGATQSVAGTSAAPDFILGSFMNVYKIGSGATNTFGNWTA